MWLCMALQTTATLWSLLAICYPHFPPHKEGEVQTIYVLYQAYILDGELKRQAEPPPPPPPPQINTNSEVTLSGLRCLNGGFSQY